jgi:hypothetical protein
MAAALCDVRRLGPAYGNPDTTPRRWSGHTRGGVGSCDATGRVVSGLASPRCGAGRLGCPPGALTTWLGGLFGSRPSPDSGASSASCRAVGRDCGLPRTYCRCCEGHEPDPQSAFPIYSLSHVLHDRGEKPGLDAPIV